MNKKREYTHEDIEAQGREMEVLRQRAHQVDQDIRIGAISHEQWVSAAYVLMERKKEILTRMMSGDDDYRSMIPCYYTPGKKQEKRSLDIAKCRKVQSNTIFQKIM